MSLYFIRHGKTSYNQSGRLTGSVNVPLNAAGKREVKNIIKKLPKNIKEIWCSDLLRARQTCYIINKELNLPVKYTFNLRGRSFGSLEGKTWEQVTEMYPSQQLRLKDKKQQYNYHPYGGDSVGDIKKRVKKVCACLKKKNHDVLVITSGGVIRLLRYACDGRIRLNIRNCLVHKLNL